MNTLKLQVITSIVRSVLMALAGWLAALGLVDDTAVVVDILLPAILLIITTVWSYLEKRSTQQEIAVLRVAARR